MLSELVYLSDAKLRQFVPLARRRFSGRLKMALKVSTPLVGVDVSPAATNDERERLDHLRRVTEQIESHARWFTDAEHRPGQWIWFEAPLNDMLLDDPFSHMVVFLDPGDPVEGYDPVDASGRKVRLLMHGSAEHLLLPALPPRQEPPPAARTVTEYATGGTTWTSGGGGSSTSPGYSEVTRSRAWFRREGGQAHDTLDTLGHQDLPVLPADSPPTEVSRLGHFHRGTAELVDWLDRRASAPTAAWTRGYARVTADLAYPPVGGDTAAPFSRVVIASPLYVEYAHDLP
ncbi:SAVMC3_10250 family protein [Streptomyces sp. NBC_00448]|uniref:SAVMC3_10250 family protein n=1 Tax=Streptomyces sp. NBC_00448 TaxID=2903652 RepID=UPI002E1F7AD5